MLGEDKQYRNVLGRFTTGVCVVSAISTGNVPIGMTINSFSSLSLDPSLIQWNLKKNSLCYPLFSRLRAYSISVLSQEQINVSQRYARAGDHALSFDDYQVSESGMPFIKDSIAHFECRKWRKISAGDHDIMLGVVDRFFTLTDAKPLVFFSGKYCPLLID